MQILRRLPFSEAPSSVEVAGESVAIRAYQIIVWVSLSVEDVLADEAAKFPAVFDTGHSHNFSIEERQLGRWAGVELEGCPTRGAILVNRQEVPLRKVNLWVHRNRPGTGELLPKPYRIPLPEGIAVYPAGTAGAPRLPLLGLRGPVRNRLRLVIDGTQVSLSDTRERS